jgi:hypothetical protein
MRMWGNARETARGEQRRATIYLTTHRSEAERMSNALRMVLAVPKEAILKAEAKLKKAKKRKRKKRA